LAFSLSIVSIASVMGVSGLLELNKWLIQKTAVHSSCH
jgi:hypothetical protein